MPADWGLNKEEGFRSAEDLGGTTPGEGEEESRIGRGAIGLLCSCGMALGQPRGQLVYRAI